MNYIFAIKTAIIIFPIIAFLLLIPFILHEYHKYGSIYYLRMLIIYSFILYLMVIFFLVILPLPTFEEALHIKGPHFNFVPFKFVSEFITDTSLVISKPSTYLKALTEPCFYVVVFNILMTIPFGMYLRYFFKCSLKKTVFYTFLLSVFFEFTQGTGLYHIYPNPYRLCDVDDLIQNTLGGALGYLLMGTIKFLPTRDEIDVEAKTRGQIVSGLRRLTIFFLDLFLYLIFWILISIFIKEHSFLISFLIYYGLIPLILNKSTFGMKFLNVKMNYNKYGFIVNIIRNIFVFFYYFYLPFACFILTRFLVDYYSLSNINIFCYLISLLFIFFFLILNVLTILFKGHIYYDKLFGFKLDSTIKL